MGCTFPAPVVAAGDSEGHFVLFTFWWSEHSGDENRRVELCGGWNEGLQRKVLQRVQGGYQASMSLRPGMYEFHFHVDGVQCVSECYEVNGKAGMDENNILMVAVKLSPESIERAQLERDVRIRQRLRNLAVLGTLTSKPWSVTDDFMRNDSELSKEVARVHSQLTGSVVMSRLHSTVSNVFRSEDTSLVLTCMDKGSFQPLTPSRFQQFLPVDQAEFNLRQREAQYYQHIDRLAEQRSGDMDTSAVPKIDIGMMSQSLVWTPSMDLTEPRDSYIPFRIEPPPPPPPVVNDHKAKTRERRSLFNQFVDMITQQESNHTLLGDENDQSMAWTAVDTTELPSMAPFPVTQTALEEAVSAVETKGRRSIFNISISQHDTSYTGLRAGDNGMVQSLTLNCEDRPETLTGEDRAAFEPLTPSKFQEAPARTLEGVETKSIKRREFISAVLDRIVPSQDSSDYSTSSRLQAETQQHAVLGAVQSAVQSHDSELARAPGHDAAVVVKKSSLAASSTAIKSTDNGDDPRYAGRFREHGSRRRPPKPGVRKWFSCAMSRLRSSFRPRVRR